MISNKIFFLLAISLMIIIVFCGFANVITAANQTTTLVVITVCGNGIVETGEECDDGNIIDSDGCSSTCQTDQTEAGGGGGGGGGGGIFIRPTVTRVILQGKAYPNTIITILKDGRAVMNTKADYQANFKAEIFDITAGVYTFGLYAEDNNGIKSVVFNFTTSVNANTITTISGIFLPPTISLSATSLGQGENLNILGQTAPESKVSIYVNSTKEIIKKIKADNLGVWRYNLKTDILRQGSHTVRARTISSEGLLSTFSQTLSFSINKAVGKEACPGVDLNSDNRVDLVDFSILLYWWGKENKYTDQNNNGIVDLTDFSIMMYYWTG